jgi:hypothetical protein
MPAMNNTASFRFIEDRVPRAFSPAAMLLRGALLAYLGPRLLVAEQSGCMALIDRVVGGMTSRTYQRHALIDALKQATEGKLKAEDGIADLRFLLAALELEIARADRVTLTIV